MSRGGLTSELLHELSMLFRIEADSIMQPYAWPPRAPLTGEERREVDRLVVTSYALRYRGNVAAYEEQSDDVDAAAEE